MAASAITVAGTWAHRCGWSVRRLVRKASSAHEDANAARADPVMTCSSAPAKGPVTAAMAASAPPRMVSVTIRPMWPRVGVSVLAVGGWRRRPGVRAWLVP